MALACQCSFRSVLYKAYVKEQEKVSRGPIVCSLFYLPFWKSLGPYRCITKNIGVKKLLRMLTMFHDEICAHIGIYRKIPL